MDADGREARRLSQSYTLAFALLSALFVEREILPADLVLQHADELIGLNLGWLSPVGSVFRSWCLSLGRSPDDAGLMSDTLRDYRATGAMRFVPYFLMLKADAFERIGRRAAALQQLAEAVE